MPLKVSPTLATVTGSRRRTGAPRSPRGTRLKATTERAFLVSAGSPPTGSGYRRGLFIIAARADRGSPPIQSKAAPQGLWPSRRRVPIARRPRPEARRISSGLPLLIACGESAMTERIHEFLCRREDNGPCLVVDLEVVRDNYRAFASALPDTRVFYAVKANPSPEVLRLLAGLGSCF